MFQLALDILIPAVVLFVFLRWFLGSKRKEGEVAGPEPEKKEE